MPFEVVLLLPPGLELDSSTLDFLGIPGVSSPRSPPPLGPLLPFEIEIMNVQSNFVPRYP